MPFLEQGFRDEIERAVAAAETTTSVEFVVVVAARSGHYRDVSYLVGAAAATLTVALALFAPWTVGPWLVIPEALAAFGVGVWLTGKVDGLVRLLTTSRRRRRQVEQAAHAVFSTEAVHATRERTGLLVYVSLLERDLVLLPDVGIDARMGRGPLNEVERSVRASGLNDTAARQAFLEGLRRCGQVLSAALPPTGDNPNELPDRPRVLR